MGLEDGSGHIPACQGVGGCLDIQGGVDCRSGAMVYAVTAPASEMEGFSLMNRRFLDKEDGVGRKLGQGLDFQVSLLAALGIDLDAVDRHCVLLGRSARYL